MKTLILRIIPLWALVMLTCSSQGQTITNTAGTVTSCPGEIQVPLDVTNCNEVGAISLVLFFNNTALTYVGYQNLNGALTTGLLIVNSTGNKVVISWANSTAANIGSATLIKLRFTSNAVGSSNFIWDSQTPGNCEYSDVLGNILPSAYVNGTANINQSPAILSQPADQTALVGQTPAFSLSASGSGLGLQWQGSSDGGATWADLTNNGTYNNVNGWTLYMTNVQLTLNGSKYRCRVTGTCPPSVYTNAATLTVINPITTSLPVASFCPGGIMVPLTVTNFNSVASFSLTFSYNPSILTYTGFQALNPALSGGSFLANASGGKVYLTWVSTADTSFGNGTIVQLLFNGVTGYSDLTWDVATPGNCEYTDLGGNKFTPVFYNGNETIYALPAIVGSPVNATIAKGQNTSFNVTASGSGLIYQWQLSTSGGTSWSDLGNGGYYSNVTGSTLYVSGAQLALSGSQYRCKVSGDCSPVVYSGPATLIVLPNIITTCNTLSVCPGPLVIPVNVTDFIGVASFSLVLNFNPAVLTYTGYQNLNPVLSGGSFVNNSVAGKVYLSWSGNADATIASGGELMELKFTGITGNSSLNWDLLTPGNCEYSDINGLVIFSTWNNGNATIYQSPVITSQPANTSIYSGGNASFSVGATGTGLSYQWQLSTDGGANWANLYNTSPYSGVYSTTLNIIPASTSMNSYQYHCIVSGTCSQAVASDLPLQNITVGSGQPTCYNATQTITAAGSGTTFVVQNNGNAYMIAGQKISYLDGTKVNPGGYMHGYITTTGQYCNILPPQSDAAQLSVTQAPVTTAPSGIANSCTGNLYIPLNVTNCNNIGSISLTLLYDTTKMTYDGYQDVHGALASGMLVVNRYKNKVILSWASSTAASVGSASLITYRFKAGSGISTTLLWDTSTPGSCEYSDINGVNITSFYNNAVISVVANALQVNAGNDITMTVPPVQFTGSAVGGLAPYTWQWTPSTWLTNPLIPNPVASPHLTTDYVLTVTGNNGCVASDPMTVTVTVPPLANLQNMNLVSGQTYCYNAIQTLTVAGGGTTFVLQNGSSATLIAGQNIDYLPGTQVQAGSYMHGYITTDGQYCFSLPPPMVKTSDTLQTTIVPDNSFFKIYPNPTPGTFILELTKETGTVPVYAEVVDMRGQKIIGETFAGVRTHIFTLSGNPSGMYFIHVICGTLNASKKILKY